jgi:tRNA (guanine-N7-)-methyltransferase
LFFATQIVTTTATTIHNLESILKLIDLPRLFSAARPVEVELGSGDGSFLVNYAAKHGERNFIGIERLLGRLRKTDRKARRLGLQNVALVRIESSYFLRYLLPPKSASAIHVYFPDPWPKRKHRRHRLISESFPEIAARALVADGEVHLRTDDADYFEQMNAVFGDAVKLFQQVPIPEALSSVLTDFEKGFHAKGIKTLAASFQMQRQPRPLY